MHVDLYQCIVVKAGGGELCPAACATAFPLSVHSQDCLQNTPVYGDQGGGMEIQILENDNVYLIPNYTFSCHGNVTQWKACVESGGGGEKYTIIFSVLRPGSELPNCYSLVDYNTLSLDAAPTNSCVTLDVPVNQVSISVQPGDVVGVLPMSVNTNNNNGIEIDVNVTGVTAWYAPVNNFMVADRSPCAYRILDGNLSLSISVAPVITAVVGKSYALSIADVPYAKPHFV